ncbi:transposase [Cetobacterium sp.]
MKYDYRNKASTNSRTGYRSKKLKNSASEIKINVPRDRCDEYESQVIKKH